MFLYPKCCDKADVSTTASFINMHSSSHCDRGELEHYVQDFSTEVLVILKNMQIGLHLLYLIAGFK